MGLRELCHKPHRIGMTSHPLRRNRKPDAATPNKMETVGRRQPEFKNKLQAARLGGNNASGNTTTTCNTTTSQAKNGEAQSPAAKKQQQTDGNATVLMPSAERRDETHQNRAKLGAVRNQEALPRPAVACFPKNIFKNAEWHQGECRKEPRNAPQVRDYLPRSDKDTPELCKARDSKT